LASVSFVVGQSPLVFYLISFLSVSYHSFGYLISCIEILDGLKFSLLCNGELEYCSGCAVVEA